MWGYTFECDSENEWDSEFDANFSTTSASCFVLSNRQWIDSNQVRSFMLDQIKKKQQKFSCKLSMCSEKKFGNNILEKIVQHEMQIL